VRRLSALGDVVLRSVRFPIIEVALAVAMLSVVGSGGLLALSIPPFAKGIGDELWTVSSSCGIAVFITVIVSMVCGWSFASMVSHGEAVNVLSMPVGRRTLLTLAAAGCVVAPVSILATCASVAAAVYSSSPTPSGVAVATLAEVAVPTLVFSIILAVSAIAKSRWGAVAAGFASWIGLSFAGSVASLILRTTRISLGEAIAVSCLSPASGAVMLYSAASAKPIDIALPSSLIDIGVAAAIVLYVVLIHSRRWEPV